MPISSSTAKIALTSSPRPYAVDVTIRRVLRGCANKRAQNTAGPTPRPRSARLHGFGNDLRRRRGRAAGRHHSGHWPGGAAVDGLDGGALQVARPVDDLWSSSASRDGRRAAPPPREAPLRRGCALQMLGVWLGAAARAAAISVPFARHCSIDIRVQRRCRCTNSCVQAAPDACNPWLRSYSTGLRCRARAFQRRLGDSWRGEKLPRMPGVQSALLCFAPAPEFAALSVESADQLLSCGSS